jgi:hypothetical protein
MTVDAPEILAPEALLEQFKARYDAIVNENQQLLAKIRDNEQIALKLQGAMETIQYLNPELSTPEEKTETEEVSE